MSLAQLEAVIAARKSRASVLQGLAAAENLLGCTAKQVPLIDPIKALMNAQFSRRRHCRSADTAHSSGLIGVLDHRSNLTSVLRGFALPTQWARFAVAASHARQTLWRIMAASEQFRAVASL
jgi:hypothetical protein